MKKSRIINYAKKGFNISMINRLTGIHYRTIKIIIDNYQKNNSFIFKCGCSRILTHRGNCKFRLNINHTKLVMPVRGNTSKIATDLTNKDEKQCVLLYLDGMSIMKLSNLFKKTPKYVSSILKRHSIQIKKTCAHDKNTTGYGEVPFEIYRVWYNMIYRCLKIDSKSRNYKYYRGRGISVCDEWQKNAKIFYEDMGDLPKGKTLHRIDSDGNYEPNNCRWASVQEQNKNRIFNRFK